MELQASIFLNYSFSFQLYIYFYCFELNFMLFMYLLWTPLEIQGQELSSWSVHFTVASWGKAFLSFVLNIMLGFSYKWVVHLFLSLVLMYHVIYLSFPDFLQGDISFPTQDLLSVTEAWGNLSKRLQLKKTCEFY